MTKPSSTLAALSNYRDEHAVCPLVNYRNLLPKIDPDLRLDGTKAAEKVLFDLKKTQLKHKVVQSDSWILSNKLSNGVDIVYPGYEKQIHSLDQWMRSQPDFSIGLHDLFEHALTITGNEAEQAIALCWNILSHNNHSSIIERNMRDRTLKLKDITGERALYNDQGGQGIGHLMNDMRGDNYSAWYHFFGTALYSYSKEVSSIPRLPLSAVIITEYTLFTWGAANTEKRIQIDKAGGKFGEKIALYVKFPPKPSDPRFLDAPSGDNYLYNDPVFYKDYAGHNQNIPTRPMSIMEKALLGRLLSKNPSLVPAIERECIWKTLETDNWGELREYIQYLRGNKAAFQQRLDFAKDISSGIKDMK